MNKHNQCSHERPAGWTRRCAPRPCCRRYACMETIVRKIVISVFLLWCPISMAQNTDYASYCSDFSEIFREKGVDHGGIPSPGKLDASKLDYSIESLKAVDAYLQPLYESSNTLDQNQVTNLIVWGGCYVGESIKKHSSKGFKWMNYHDYMAQSPQAKKLEESGLLSYGPGTSIILVSSTGAMTLPLNKIARFIYEGPENNIHFYATGELK